MKTPVTTLPRALVQTHPRQRAKSWLFLCPPGLASQLKKEMITLKLIERKQNIFIKRLRNHDLLLVNQLAYQAANHAEGSDASGSHAVSRLRIAEASMRCPVFGRYKVSKNQLQILTDELHQLGPRRLVVSVAGRHFQRHDFARWVEREVSARGYDFDPEVEDEVWLFCVDEAFYFGFPQTKSRDIEGRDERQTERHGSLPPSTAAALVFAAAVRPDDVVLDPVCGSGSLLAEAYAYQPHAVLLGLDRDAQAVAIARRNLGSTDTNKQFKIIHGDATATELQRTDITLVLANLPFGRQFGSQAENPALYRALLAEALRLRNPSRWRAVLLTSDTGSLQAALAHFPQLSCKELFKVKIRGHLATAFHLGA